MTVICRTLQEWYAFQATITQQTLGFVPTMGNLHSGHLALCQRSIAENDLTALSIFVNPTQFNNPDDLQKYPRTLTEDIIQAKDCGVDVILLPSYDELYPDNYSYKISEHNLSNLMEGQSRPGHFDGVLTICMKLFQIVQAQHAYFGEKDFQQLTLLQGLAKAFFLKTRIVACPTIRTTTGLALSSRNHRLSETDRLLAEQFSKHLQKNCSLPMIKNQLESLGFTVDYIEEHLNRRFGAVYLNKVRLIDNIALEEVPLC